jgi:hypothetical protein
MRPGATRRRVQDGLVPEYTSVQYRDSKTI